MSWYLDRKILELAFDDGSIHYRSMTGAEAEILQKADDDGSIRALAEIFCMCVVDQNTGQPVHSVGDVDTIMSKVGVGLLRAVSDAVLDASGLGEDSGND